MSYPLISVIIPCYNHEKYVEDCIRSVCAQTYDNIELIIIDDGSKDASVESIRKIVLECENRFVRFEFRTRTNIGLCGTLNEALDWCEGKFSVIFASDDIMMPDRFSKQINKFSEMVKIEPNLVAIYSGVEMIDSEGQYVKVKHGSDKFSGFDEAFLRTEFLPTPTCIVLTDKLKAAGGFNPNFMIEDLFIRLKLTAANGVFYTMKEPLVKYRQHSDNMSSKSDLIWQGVKDILSEYRDHVLYEKALAMSMLIQAHDVQKVSKIHSLKQIGKALSLYPNVFFTKSLVKLVAKMFLPRPLVK
ncbi:glycosyltransferase [Rheinheimera sp. 1928-s]|uniref:glycosyltransferase n=1 Tax=Rheinheimera sp. 1928-s TaxID=3033803 RepID=UPI00262C67F6|nr:glycosyltransferase [Rheinheimera sp. 1928-s]MDF3125761.1 glycosyltransferase [Rheinheimera sp. 1928-s]